MSELKITDWPWQVEGPDGTGEPDSQKQYNGKPYQEYSRVTGKTGDFCKGVAHIYQGDKGPVGSPEALEEQLANARLIAAAPELLEACRELLRHCERYLGPTICGGEMTNARAAIEKATGES